MHILSFFVKTVMQTKSQCEPFVCVCCRHIGKVVVNSPHSHPKLQPSKGTIIITGGLGSLGTLLSGWLAQSVSNRLCLTGRTGRTSSQFLSSGLRDLVTHSLALVSMASCDSSNEDDVRCLLLQKTEKKHPPVFCQGVMHAGGQLADGLIANMTPESIRRVFAPKAAAAQVWQKYVNLQPATLQVVSLAPYLSDLQRPAVI